MRLYSPTITGSLIISGNIISYPADAFIDGKVTTSFSSSYSTISISSSYLSGSATGSLFGTSSWAFNSSNALSSSFASTASLAPNYVLNNATSSFVQNSQTSSFVQNSQTSSFTTTSSFNSFTSSINNATSSFVQNSQTSSFVTNSQTSSFVTNSQTSSFVQNSQTSSFVTNSQTSSFVQNSQTSSFVTNDQTSSFVQNSQTSSMTVATASYVNTLNQNVFITGALAIGTSSLGSTENTLVLGPPPSGIGNGEGGQILLQAPNSGGYTSASMIDNYQNQFRVLRGTNVSSSAQYMGISMHSGQATFNKYSGSGAFGGTPTAKLAVASNGDMLTVANGYVPQLDLYSALGSTTKAEPFFVQGGILGGSGQTMTSQTLYGQAILIPQQTTITGAKWYRTTTGGVYTANNYNGVGLYSYSAGTLTLVASSSNDGTIWSSSYGGTNTFATKSFAASYTAAPGIYFVVALYCSSAQTTGPFIGSGNNAIFSANVSLYDYTNGAKHFIAAGGVTTLASSVSISTYGGSISQVYLALY